MTDVRGARSLRMMRDPNLSGDTLLVGLVLAARVDFGLKLKGLKQLAALAFPDGTERANYYRAKKAFRDDIRTYRPPIRHMDEAVCDAPMVRRFGQPDYQMPSAIGWEPHEQHPLQAMLEAAA